MEESYPAVEFSLRTASNQQIILRLNNPSEIPKVLGIVDKESAYWMVHPGAIYLHEGESFHVDNLNLQDNFATLSPILPDYYTEPERKTTFAIDVLINSARIQGAEKFIGEITVTSQVSGFKKINWRNYEVLGREVIELPPTSLITTGFWLALSQETETALREIDLWSSGPNEYGPEWSSIRETIIERDHNTCQICGTGESNSSLHVHHKQPLRSFPNFADANQFGNLVTLCSRCHQRAETVVRVNSGIRGLGFVLHGLAPLLLMCDPGDLGVFTEFNSPLGKGRPVVLLHEQIPLGIGYSNNLFERERELLEKTYQLVSLCSCQDGCPSCVGPGGEKGSGGKKETLAILNHLLD
jgi:DEAD/DEAH box helicase domain-containing protein